MKNKNKLLVVVLIILVAILLVIGVLIRKEKTNLIETPGVVETSVVVEAPEVVETPDETVVVSEPVKEPIVEPEPVVVPEPIVKSEPEPIVVPEPIVEPEPEPIVVPEPEPIAPPVSSSLPYIRDGRIYLDVREDPEAVNSVLLMPSSSDIWAKSNELLLKRRQLPEYGAYFPVVGEITTYIPGFEDLGTFTTDLLDGGIFYVTSSPEIEYDIWGNLSTAILLFFDDNNTFGTVDLTNINDIPHEDGLHYFGAICEGTIKYVVRYYVYFVD